MMQVEGPHFLYNEAAPNAPRLIHTASSLKSTHQVAWTSDEKEKNITREENGKAKIL
jgi:hypothetical protein